MSKQNGLTDKLLQALEECGPMTAAELVVHIGQTKHRVAAATSRLRKAWPITPKRIHITSYVFDHEGQRDYPRPVFALGNYPDATRPKTNRKEIKRRYEARRKARVTNNFVFNLGRQTHKVTVSNLAKGAQL